jgi:1-phosphofructokinase family hexose kinase
MIYTTLYNPAIDLLYEVEDLSSQNTFTSLSTRQFPAGKGMNVAKVIKALGEEVTVIAIMPSDDKERFENYLKSLGIDFLFFSVNGAVRINTTIVENSSSITQHFNAEGDHFSTQIQDEFEAFVSKLVKKGDSWIFSGSIPSGIDSDSYAKMITLCNSRGATTILDSRDNALDYGIMSKPLIISPNETELELFFKEPIEGVKHIALKGKKLIDMGIEFVFITLGESGVIALHKSECLLCSLTIDKIVDTVGCGDAFLGGVVVGRERGFDFREICRLAVASGASNACHTGPGEVNKDQVWRFMERVEIESI